MRIKNARIALPGEDEFFLGDIRIEQEKIIEIGTGLNGEDPAWDAGELLIFPGGIDAHVHFDDPGYTHREDFFHGTAAAASGGITTVIDMPCTSVPPVTNLENLHRKLESIKPKAVIDYGLYGGVSGQSFAKALNGDLDKMSELILGVKVYFISGMNTFARITPVQLTDLLKITKALDLPVLLHAEDFDIIDNISKSVRPMPGTPDDYYHSRPELTEIKAVRSAIEAAERANSRLHIVHISTAEAAQFLLISDNVTCETAPHYLAFDVTDFVRMGSVLKVTPPVKKPGNAEALWQMLADEEISFVASDHAPASYDEKNTGSIWTDYAGISGTGTLLPFLFSEGYFKYRLSLSRFTDIISGAPARQYGIDYRKGGIVVGKDADLVVIDPNKIWEVTGEKFLSKGKITPFEGMPLNGRVMRTMCRGEWVYFADKGLAVEPGFGEHIIRD